MEIILLLLLGVAIIIIIIQATKNKKSSPQDTISFQMGKDEDFEDYSPPKRKTKSKISDTPVTKTKREGNFSSNPDIGPEDFMIWKANEIPTEYLTPKKDVENTSSFFYGKKVCISGQLDNFPYRGELAEYLWNAGADINKTVSKKCGVLIAGDGVGPKKLQIAEKEGVYIMDQAELDEKINGFKSKYI